MNKRDIELHRRMFFDGMRDVCTKGDHVLQLSHHFVERFNLRAVDQVESLKHMMVALKHILNKPEEKYSIKIGTDMFLVARNEKKQVVWISYTNDRTGENHFDTPNKITLVKK